MMTEIILIIIFAFLLIHYIYFLLQVFLGLNKLSTVTNDSIPDEFISIIIPFRSEEENIINIYNSLIEQNYPAEKYEVIFINDSSEDSSLEILNRICDKKNVRIFSVPVDYSANAHKKRAIRFGLEKSIGEIIVTTDADCIHPKDWLSNLLKFMDNETGFVSGPVQFKYENTIFKKMQRLEFAGLVITGAGLIGAGNPTICNAANIAYRKKVYDEVGGFTYQMNLSSGDDELLMQKIHSDTNHKIKFALDKNAIVTTNANSNIKDFYYQRKRWASKGLFYGDNLLLLKLILIFLFYLSLIIQPVFGVIISSKYLISFTVSYVCKIFIELLVMKRGIKLLFDKEMLKPFFITELIQVPYIIISGVSGLFGNYIWKNRKIKR